MISLSKTRRGVYHNLSESEYAISNTEVAFFFSSRFYLEKFMDKYKTHRNEYRIKVDRMFIDHPLKTNFIADLHLYKNIEKRGFRVEFKGDEETWQNLHQLELDQKISKNLQDWHEM